MPQRSFLSVATTLTLLCSYGCTGATDDGTNSGTTNVDNGAASVLPTGGSTAVGATGDTSTVPGTVSNGAGGSATQAGGNDPSTADVVSTDPVNTDPTNTDPLVTAQGGGGSANTGGSATSGGGVANGNLGGAGLADDGALDSGGANSGGTSAGGQATGGAGLGPGGSAAGGASAGAGSVASGGAGMAGGSSLCPASALVCDGFEDGNLDKWTANQQGGTLSIASDYAANGQSALLVDVPANQHGGFLRLTGAPLFPLPSQVLYGRAMVMFETIPDGHTDIVRAAGNNGSVPLYNLGEQHEEILLNYFESYPGVDCWARPQPGYDLTAGEWMCWEWRFDGNTNEILFYINGELERTVSQTGDGCLEGNATWDAPDFATFEVGAYVAELSANRTERFWIDDVAVGTEERFGCPQP